MLLHLVPARDAEVDLALANEGRNIRRGKEQQGDGEVLDKGNVEAVLALELDLGIVSPQLDPERDERSEPHISAL